MLAQYTAAALVAENKILCHPASVDSIPTSGDQEDHVSMGMTAALKLGDVLGNTQTDSRHRGPVRGAGDRPARAAQPGVGSGRGHEIVRRFAAPLERDRYLAPGDRRRRGGGRRR